MNREQVYVEVQKILTELFEISAQDVSPEAKLFEDLGLDSIDSIDLIVKLQEYSDVKIKGEDFRSIRTVDQLVDECQKILKNQ